MGVYYRKDTGQWAISYVDQSGRRQRLTVGTKRQAEDELRALTGPSKCRVRLNEYAISVLKALSIGLARSTVATYAYHAQALEALGDPRLDEVDLRLVRRYQAERVAQVSSATTNREIMFLSRVMTQAVADGYLAQNPLRGLQERLQLDEGSGPVRFLSVAEIANLEAQCRDPLLGIVQVALRTGMRMREIFQLQWARTDLGQGFAEVKRKHKRGMSRVPLPPLTIEAIRRQPRSSTFVFQGRGGQRDNCRKAFASALKRAGLKDVTFHTLRHTFASQAVMNGMDLRTLQEILGHSKLDMVMRYAHLAESHKVEQLEKLEARLSRAKGPGVTDPVTRSRKVFTVKRGK